MNYIVSGYMRTGTSMMMQALEAGGMDAAYDRTENDVNNPTGNPNGYYELHSAKYTATDWPKDYTGKVVKIMWGGLLRLPIGFDYKIIFMRRDRVATLNSFCKLVEGVPGAIIPGPLLDESQFSRNMNAVMDVIGIRGIPCEVVQYEDARDCPRAVFDFLAAQGWPIDPTLAASAVDPRLDRSSKQAEREVANV